MVSQTVEDVVRIVERKMRCASSERSAEKYPVRERSQSVSAVTNSS
jgi:hypothetical protein